MKSTKIIYPKTSYRASREERLKEITEKYTSTPLSCSNCGREIRDETYFSVNRWSEAKKSKEYRFCKDCCETKDKVLYLIDRDKVMFGVSQADDFFDYVKTTKVSKEFNNKYIQEVYQKFSDLK